MIEMWEMRLSFISPVGEQLANLLFPQSPLQFPRLVLWELFWLNVPFAAPRHCLVFVRGMTI